MNSATVFCRLTKVNQAAGTVSGTITREEVDQAGECFDFDSSIPFVKAWSDAAYQRSNGLSRGNLREMHSSKAVGKIVDLTFNRAAKSIDVTARITDPATWDGVQQGVFTGFSLGGQYIKKWDAVVDGRRCRKYTASVNEVSIVDSPCVGSAVLQVQKSNGAITFVKFRPLTVYNRSAEFQQVIPDAGADAEGRLAFARALRKIHAGGGRDELAKYLGMRSAANLHKLTLPPEEEDGDHEKGYADTGGERVTAGESGTPRQKVTPFLRPQTASERQMGRGKMAIDASDAASASGSGDDAQNAIKMALQNPQPLFGR